MIFDKISRENMLYLLYKYKQDEINVYRLYSIQNP